MTRTQKLTALVREVPWLGELPQQVLGDLDLGELAVPRGAVATIRRGLERVLRVRVMTYRIPPPPPAGRELCQTQLVARLRLWQLVLMRLAERVVAGQGVVFCAYERADVHPARRP